MTTTPVHAVLLTPEKGDPLGLLHGEPCGAKPPIAFRVDCKIHGVGWFAANEKPCCLNAGIHLMAGESTEALVLVWKGEPVPMGMDRVRRCGLDIEDDEVLRNAEDWATIGIMEGTVVLLDVRGTKGPPTHCSRTEP
jgi:hypothetical protein